jgi:hypothetical protein
MSHSHHWCTRPFIREDFASEVDLERAIAAHISDTLAYLKKDEKSTHVVLPKRTTHHIHETPFIPGRRNFHLVCQYFDIE